MPGIIRVGDANINGGIASGPGVISVLVNNQPVCTTGTKVTPHPPCGAPAMEIHCVAVTTLGSTSVRVGGQIPNYVGNADSCGDIRLMGSTDVIIGV